MLKLFRNKTVLTVIAFLIVLTFIAFGGVSMQKDKDKGTDYVGFVHDRKISFDELGNALLGVRSQIILNYFNQPKVLNAILSDKPMLAKLAWDRVLMMEEVKKAGIKVSDKEIVDALRSHPLFIRNGAFDDKFYTYMLTNNIGMEPRAFEEIVRENLSLQKMSASLTKDIKLSDDDILSAYRKEFAKVKISYILLNPKEYLDKVTISETAAKDFYDKNKAELMIKAAPKTGATDRPATFEESKADLEKYLKEIEARKMLKDKSDQIYKELSENAGNTTEEFAKAASRMGLTAKDTDFFSKKDTVDAIGDTAAIVAAASGLKELELSKPLENAKGFIIFRITAKQAADETNFSKEKEEFSKKLLDAKANVVMEDWLRGLEEKAKLAIKLEDMTKNFQ